MSRRVDFRDELDVQGEMSDERAEAIAAQKAERATREWEAVKYLRQQKQALGAREAEVAALAARREELERAIATRETQAQQSHARTVADRGEELARLAADTERATAENAQQQARNVALRAEGARLTKLNAAMSAALEPARV